MTRAARSRRKVGLTAVRAGAWLPVTSVVLTSVVLTSVVPRRPAGGTEGRVGMSDRADPARPETADTPPLIPKTLDS